MKYYLLADIGGTNSNFALLKITKKEQKIFFKRKYKTKDYDNFTYLVNKYLDEFRLKSKIVINNALFAVAGKIKENNAKLSNNNLKINIKELQKKTSLKNIKIINDFIAIAYAIETLKSSQLINLNKGEKTNKKPMIVIGAGTGLGKSTLYYDKNNNSYIPKESEAGHQDISINDIDEFLLLKFIKLKTKKKNVEYEEILSGRGLEIIYQFLSQKNKTAEEISKDKKTDKYAKQTLKIFFKFYARFAKNSFIDSFSEGGIYIAGGIIEKNLDIPKKIFLDEFTNNHLFKSNLKKVSINIIKNYNISIQGLKNYIIKNE